MAKILVFDCDMATRVVLQHTLDCYDVVLAETATHAVALALWAKPDLLIADTECDGIGAVVKILQDMSVPVIFMSAYYDSIKIPAEIPHYALVGKPFDPIKLRSTVCMALLSPITNQVVRQSVS